MMKKLFLLLFVAAVMASCSNSEPVETRVAKANVEIAGNSFGSFKLGSDVKLIMSQSPSEKSKWNIKATVPIQKIDPKQFSDLTIEMNLLDENKLNVHDGFSLTGEGIANVLPLINNDPNVERDIVFTASENSKKDFTYKEAVDILNKTKSLRCSFTTSEPVVEAATPEPEPEEEVVVEKKEEPKYNYPPKTVNDICMKYGIYGKMSQYDKALRNGEKKKAKRIEDDMYEICKRVKKDPNVPEWLAKNFKDYVEDREDEIEDKY